jgi:4-amino-4-deoxy-L-arabinose transferase-like glycosyltransferase
MYARLTVGLLMVTASVWMLIDRRARSSLATPGPWIGLALFLILCAPLARWLVDNEFLPLSYASARAARSPGIAAFVMTSLMNLSGVAVLLLLARLLPWPGQVQRPADLLDGERTRADRRALTLLLVFTLVPLALAIAGALVSRGGLKTGWGNSMFNFVGLLAVLLTSHRFTRHSLKAIAIAAAVCVSVVPLGYALVIGVGPRLAGLAGRVHWPQGEIAERMSTVWTRQTGRPLRIVTGDNWIAGLIGLTAEGRPSILDHGDLRLSPWITPSRIDAEGMLVAWDARRSPPQALHERLTGYVVREESFAWPRSSDRPPLVIRYVVIPPARPRP